MNVADSQRVGSSLEHLGYTFTETIEEADVIVLNTCVVRQSAEDKAMCRVTSLSPLKKQNPNLVINLMGCMVGVRGAEKLREKLPFVDVFSPPSDPGPLVSFLSQGELRSIETDETARRFAYMDGDLILPAQWRSPLVEQFAVQQRDQVVPGGGFLVTRYLAGIGPAERVAIHVHDGDVGGEEPLHRPGDEITDGDNLIV